jgi:DNA-binding SARP family transcriptional activator
VIEILALGPPVVGVGGGDPPRELLWKKNLALLVYLALSPHGRRGREHLIGLFWADKTEAKARHSLNEALRALRKAAGDESVTSRGDQVVLDPDSVRIDVDDFMDAMTRGDTREAAALIRGPFMEGFFVAGSSGFEDWLHTERAELSLAGSTALLAAGEDLLARGHVVAARDVSDRALQLDRFAEGPLRMALLARALAGERAQAVALFDEFSERLRGELELEPSDETLELIERIRREKAWKLPTSMPEQERVARRVPLVGRSEELTASLAALSAGFEARRATALFVLGDPGLGKTRLAEEILARARMDGARTVRVRAISADRDTPGAVESGLLRELRAPEDVPPEGDSLADAIRDEVRDAPLLIWLDDADQADARSLGEIRRLLADARDLPVAFGFGATAVPSVASLDELRADVGREIDGAIVHLKPFTLDLVGELAQTLLPAMTDVARDRLCRRVFADSAGLPLLSLELLNAVRLGLELHRIEGSWPKASMTLVDTFPGDLPDSVVAAIRVGFRRLSEHAQQVLTAAAILGERVSQARLAQMTGLDEEDLTSALDELEWQRWLTADARGYSFVAPVVKDVVARDMLTPGQKRRLLVSAGLLSD